MKKFVSIINLRVRDLVADADGVLGKVMSFKIDSVVIEIDGALFKFTDEILKQRGMILVEGCRREGIGAR